MDRKSHFAHLPSNNNCNIYDILRKVRPFINTICVKVFLKGLQNHPCKVNELCVFPTKHIVKRSPFLSTEPLLQIQRSIGLP